VESVTGIGGVFFRDRDPAALSKWYQKHLGIALMPSNYDEHHPNHGSERFRRDSGILR
jgi:hypothetical protein